MIAYYLCNGNRVVKEMNMLEWWPQIVYAALMAVGLGITMAMHGEDRGKYNFWVTLAVTIFAIGLLYAGGFWG